MKPLRLPDGREHWLVIHRDDAGFADSLDTPDGQVILHMRPGTVINERNVVGFVDRIVGMDRKIREQSAKIARLRGLLELEAQYVDHLPSCEKYDNPMGDCDCGLAALEAEVRKEEP